MGEEEGYRCGRVHMESGAVAAEVGFGARRDNGRASSKEEAKKEAGVDAYVCGWRGLVKRTTLLYNNKPSSTRN